MSTPSATPVPKPKGGGKKYGPLTRTQWIIAGVVIAGTLGFIIYRRYEASKAAAAAAASSTTSGNCTDSDGNSTPCSEDTGGGDASDMSAIEDELDQLLAGEGSGASGGTTTTTGSTGSTGTGTTTTTPPVTTGTPVSTAGNTWTYPAPTGLKNTAKVCKTCTQLVLSWNPVTGPAGQKPATYTVRIFRGSAQIRSNSVAGTSYTENGLTKGNNGLTVQVWANGAPEAPPGALLNT